jgi:glycosyltransferase involved in cell wall biosynthesis
VKILFFIESLHSGGKERRLVELLAYLKRKPQYEMLLVLTRPDIHYKKFLELGIPYEVLERRLLKKDPLLFYKFYKTCCRFRPDVIHTWGNMVSFYSLPAVLLLGIPLVNGQITSALPRIPKLSKLSVMSKLSFRFARIILANSKAGLASHGIGKEKGRVIYNGIDLERFKNPADQDVLNAKYGIRTPFAVIMVASFSAMKDHDKFIDVAREAAAIRNDVTFLAVGDGLNLERIKNRAAEDKLTNVIFSGRVEDVESLVALADIGVLFSPRGEGTSNSILEYMASGKPVLANDSGGTAEIVKHGVNGLLLSDETPAQIAGLISGLLDDLLKRTAMGEAGKKMIGESFSVDRMGKEFETVYKAMIADAAK